MGILLNKKSYPSIEYVEAALITLGVTMFSLSEPRKHHGHHAVATEPPGERARHQQKLVTALLYYFLLSTFCFLRAGRVCCLVFENPQAR